MITHHNWTISSEPLDSARMARPMQRALRMAMRTNTYQTAARHRAQNPSSPRHSRTHGDS